ncbi:kelch-like protein 10 [Cololabis saira]|uniref:kelch-like protein 10 n=1 Tax=Cololabis saira TaxID=129043 RepID=UPI002AD402B7|nr:kelch-like protein 10 [Cololabis saira]
MDISVLKELLLEESLCDAVIKVEDGEFKAHRIILCGRSSYFSDLFCSNPTQKVFSFPDVSAKVMSLIVENAYTGSVTVTEDNVLELLAGAQDFDVKTIIQACCDFLQKNLSSDSSIVTWKLAKHSQYPELREKACLYILLHFEEIARFSQEFVQLSVEELTDLIEKDELNVRQESAVFEAILRWISFAPEERRGHMTTLLPSVRLLLMPIEYLVEIVSKDDVVRNNLDCVTMVTSTVEILRDPSMERPPTRTRLPAELLFTISGFQDNLPNDEIELYNVRTDRWLTAYKNDQTFPKFCGCVHLQGSIYFIGGGVTRFHLSNVQMFTLATQSWQEVGSMHEPRRSLGVAVLNGFIYAMGGWNGHETLRSAERFQPDTNQWTEIAPMHDRRADVGAAALHGKIYICGGFSGGEPLFSAECYNPDTDQWTLITPMETARSAAGVVSYNGHIYVAGGWDGTNHVSTVSAYDPVSEHWCTAAPMLHARSQFGIAVLEEQLYVVGGFQNENPLMCSNVERYDGASDSWQAVRDLDQTFLAVSCCVVERVPHAAAYLS